MWRIRRTALAVLAILAGLVPTLVAWAAVGQADPSFGDGGVLRVFGAAGDPSIGGLALRPAGGGIAVGGSPDGLTGGMLAFTEGGQLDEAFGEDGVAVVSGSLADVALLADGSFLTVAPSPVTVSRRLSDGTIDETFGVDGSVVAPVSVAHDPEMTVSLAVDTVGRVVVVGATFDGEVVIVRVTPDGVLDPTFGDEGVLVLDFDGQTLLFSSVAVDSSNRITVGGVADRELLVFRLGANGAFDTSFADDGVFSIPSYTDEYSHAIGITDLLIGDGGVIHGVGATGQTTPVAALALALDESGRLVSDYGDDGIVVVPLEGDIILRRAAFDADGGIVATGMATSPGPDAIADLAVVRLGPDGSVEAGSGHLPMAVGDPDSLLAMGGDIAGAGDGDIVVSGVWGESWAIWRFEGPSPSVTTTSTSIVSTTTTPPGTTPSTSIVSTTTTTAPATPPSTVPHEAPTDTFSDDDGSVFETDIEWLARSGITSGCNPPANDRFCPDDAMTRGQMAAFLVRALGLTEVGSIAFTDDDESVFEPDIERLAAAGVTMGCNPPSNTLFCPNEVVTRGQMAAFLRRAWPDLALVAGPADFGDMDGSVFASDVEWLARTGVTRGCSATSFCPEDPVTRGQMAAFLHRASTS
jgi:uncharacterized delta-60 repeat protein